MLFDAISLSAETSLNRYCDWPVLSLTKLSGRTLWESTKHWAACDGFVEKSFSVERPERLKRERNFTMKLPRGPKLSILNCHPLTQYQRIWAASSGEAPSWLIRDSWSLFLVKTLTSYFESETSAIPASVPACRDETAWNFLRRVFPRSLSSQFRYHILCASMGMSWFLRHCRWTLVQCSVCRMRLDMVIRRRRVDRWRSSKLHNFLCFSIDLRRDLVWISLRLQIH